MNTYDRNDYRTRAGREHSLGADQKYETSYGNYAGEYVATEEILKQRAASQFQRGPIQPPIQQITTEHMLDLLNGSLDRLHEKISIVENAITPVLRPSDPRAEKAATADDNHAAVNLSLICLNERIGYEIERLEDIYRRSEVV